MSLQGKWYQSLCNSNPNYMSLRRSNRTWLVRDNSNLEVLIEHANLTINEFSYNSYYQLCIVEGCIADVNDQTYVPILPGYSIITLIGGSYFRFTINKDESNLLHFSWYDYGEDNTLMRVEYSYAGSDFFITFNDYVQSKRKGRVSIPDILGFNIKENIQYLRNKVCYHYPSIFNDCIKIQAAMKKTKTLVNAMKRRGDQLIEEIEHDNDIKEGILIKNEGINITKTEAQAALVKFNEKNRLLYQERKKHKRTMGTVTKQLQEKLKEKNTLNNERQLKIKELAIRSVNASQVGSTIIIDTHNYVSALLSLPCHNCGDISIDNKDCAINNIGFSVNIIICCKSCNGVSEFCNDTPKVSMSVLVAGGSLLSGINRQQCETFLSTIGITSHTCKKTFHEHQKRYFENLIEEAEISAEMALKAAIKNLKENNKNILPVSFDVSWSHVRNANQASGEFIFQGDLPGYSSKPVVAFHVVEKSRFIKVADGEQKKTHEIHKGNFDNSSRQMEHAILIACLEKITPILDEENILLDIGVDGDLDSNKTLKTERVVNKVYGDLKHATKIIRGKIIKNTKWNTFEQPIMKYFCNCIYAAAIRKASEEIETPSEKELKNVQVNGLVAHLSGDHSLCWSEVCWLKDNPDLELIEPNLLKYNDSEKDDFKTMLQKCFTSRTQQNFVTEIRTSYNESLNRRKLKTLDKKIDFWASFKARHAIAILDHNEGLLEVIKIARKIKGLSFLSENDIENIEKIALTHDVQRSRNLKNIHARNIERENKIMEQRQQLEAFNYDQDLVPYGMKFSEIIQEGKFKPSFAHLIQDFEMINRCISCASFPKSSSAGLCKTCIFYSENNMYHNLPLTLEINQLSTMELSQNTTNQRNLIQSALSTIYHYPKFRECQEEGIRSFLTNNDTMILLTTGGGKTLCYSIPALIGKELTVVFSPLKALIDDQVVKINISSFDTLLYF